MANKHKISRKPPNAYSYLPQTQKPTPAQNPTAKTQPNQSPIPNPQDENLDLPIPVTNRLNLVMLRILM